MKYFLIICFILLKHSIANENNLLSLYINDLKNIEKKFISSYSDKQKAKKLVKDLNNNLIFQNTLNKLKFSNINKKNLDSFFLNLLKIKNNPATSYVGVEFFIQMYGMTNKEKVKSYLQPLSKVLYQHKMCKGYLFYGDSLRNSFNYLQAKKVYIEGKKNCHINWIKTYIIGRLLKYY